MYAQNLKKIRTALGLSVAKLAEKIKIPASTLTGYERNERTPSNQLYTQLYKELNINLNWFVSGIGNMFNESAEQNEQLENLVERIVDKKMKEKGL